MSQDVCVSVVCFWSTVSEDAVANALPLESARTAATDAAMVMILRRTGSSSYPYRTMDIAGLGTHEATRGVDFKVRDAVAPPNEMSANRLWGPPPARRAT